MAPHDLDSSAQVVFEGAKHPAYLDDPNRCAPLVRRENIPALPASDWSEETARHEDFAPWFTYTPMTA
eukprot:3923357-Pyramimonas_sp.AAC.1